MRKQSSGIYSIIILPKSKNNNMRIQVCKNITKHTYIFPKHTLVKFYFDVYIY